MTLPAVLLGLIAAWIAYQQYCTNRERLKMDLFEKRYQVYRGVLCFIEQAMTKGTIAIEDVRDLDRSTADAFFLFDDKVVAYIWDVRSHGLTLYGVREERPHCQEEAKRRALAGKQE